MSKEKIEELAKDIFRYCWVMLLEDDAKKIAEFVIDKRGYRKQNEGEWVTSDIPQEKYFCSVCGGACWYYDCQGDVAKSRYCPNCGAHMRKEDESNG